MHDRPGACVCVRVCAWHALLQGVRWMRGSLWMRGVARWRAARRGKTLAKFLSLGAPGCLAAVLECVGWEVTTAMAAYLGTLQVCVCVSACLCACTATVCLWKGAPEERTHRDLQPCSRGNRRLDCVCVCVCVCVHTGRSALISLVHRYTGHHVCTYGTGNRYKHQVKDTYTHTHTHKHTHHSPPRTALHAGLAPAHTTTRASMRVYTCAYVCVCVTITG